YRKMNGKPILVAGFTDNRSPGDRHLDLVEALPAVDREAGEPTQREKPDDCKAKAVEVLAQPGSQPPRPTGQAKFVAN
ncbi:hypothetical protein ABTK77_19830, partial [Acinetobacter baumannii]